MFKLCQECFHVPSFVLLFAFLEDILFSDVVLFHLKSIFQFKNILFDFSANYHNISRILNIAFIAI